MNDIELQPLVSVDQQNIAQLFVDYLTSVDIAAKVEQSEQSFVVYCQAEKHEESKQIFTEFARQPYHPKYQQAAWSHGNPNAVKSDHSLIKEFSTKFLAHAGPITLAVFVVCWVVFGATLIGYGPAVFEYLKFYSTLTVDTVTSAPQRLLGPAFFHFSWLHIVFNTMWWWQLGGGIESKFGRLTLIKVFLVSAVASNLGQFIVSGENFGGLSGVVYATVGFVWFTGWLRPEKNLSLPRAIVGFMLIWLVLGYLDWLPVKMANTAHLLGLISGCLLALLENYPWKNSAIKKA